MGDPEQIEGTIERVTYCSPESGWTVAQMLTRQGPVTIVGNVPKGAVGQKVRVVGEPHQHPRYGSQLEVRYVEILQPDTRDGVIAYLSSGKFPGVGEKTARAIVAALGTEALRILDETPERIREVPGIGQRKAQGIIEALEAGRMEQKTLVMLYDLGLTPGVVNRILKTYGVEAARIVQENPYRLVKDVRGIGFITADRIARTMKQDPALPERVEAGLLHSLEDASGKEGATCLPSDEVTKRTLKLLNRDFEEAPVTKAMVEEARERLTRERLISSENGTDALRYLARCEEVIAREIRRLMRSPLVPPPPKDVDAIVDRAGRDVAVRYAPEQAQAIKAALTQSVVIITGGPGTGKTTVVRGILAALQRIGVRSVALAAPSGRAAKRLQEATDRDAQTIHRLLGLRPSTEGDSMYSSQQSVAAEAIIVDELSMCDAPLMLALLSSVGSGKRLILVGDPEQLPSVGPGNVLRDLLAAGVPSVTLAHNFRQGEGSSIIDNAHRIRRGAMPDMQAIPKSEWLVHSVENAQEAQTAVLQLAEQALQAGIQSKDVQVLTPMHRGDAGAKELNRRLQEMWNPGEPMLMKVGDTRFTRGDRVICHKNDYDKEIFNGDLGTVVGAAHSEDDDEVELIVNFDGRPVAFGRAEVQDKLGLAYALTVHKSQGSEFPIVIVIMLTEQAVLLHRNLIYTAVTRAQSQCILIGQPKAVSLAVHRPGANRSTQLVRYLNEALRG